MNVVRSSFKTECKCAKCQYACQRAPGWMTPDEARAAIVVGDAKKLMRDWRAPERDGSREYFVNVLSAAQMQYEGDNAPSTAELFGHDDSILSMFMPRQPTAQPCSLYKDGLCTIHNSGYKPIECRTAFMCDGSMDVRYVNRKTIAGMWDNGEAQALVKQWCSIVEVDYELEDWER